MSQDGVGALSLLTALGGADGGSPSLSVLTAAGHQDGGAASLEALTAAAEQLGTNATGVGVLIAATASGIAEQGTAGLGEASLEALTGEGGAETEVDCVLEAVTASGVALNGTIATGVAQILHITAEGVGGGVNPASGAGVFQPLTANGIGLQEGAAEAAVSLASIQAAGAGLTGGVGFGSPTLKRLETAGIGSPLAVAEGAPALPKLRSNGFGETQLAEEYRTWVMNAANEALSEYTNFGFNSYAKFNGKEYAAGPDGLFELTGSDDNTANISWVIKTGMMDDKKVNLKRLSELLLSLRYNGPIRIRVYTDENTYHDYTLANFREDALHQVRIPTGKGMKSRFFQVEISGMSGSSCEIDSLLVPMEPVARRAG